MDRTYLKSKSKQQLKDNLVVSIIAVFIASIFIDASNLKNGVKFFYGEGSYISLDLLTILFAGVFTAGLNSFLLKIVKNLGTPEVKDIFSCFNYYLKTLGLYLAISVIGFIGTLLFIVPGIIALIMFSQSFFILVEDPSKSIKDCMLESQKMMSGHKAEYFVLQLSFIGWYLLAGITLGIAGFWVNPYVKITNANYYLKLKENI
ncbi:DUF975 family protein [Clostridium sartagoforme]|uniref:DUF975 family protein n=1 Tax=Clostridium sartagoforme TaxID=84031 RepID=A0A4S2DNX2_9CLOT|nr:DUF975 family protein [Clostridium sartagoforme]TGY43825.1 DUF975 family protein [Clostridium sartagoforme]